MRWALFVAVLILLAPTTFATEASDRDVAGDKEDERNGGNQSNDWSVVSKSRLQVIRYGDGIVTIGEALERPGEQQPGAGYPENLSKYHPECFDPQGGSHARQPDEQPCGFAGGSGGESGRPKPQ